MKKLITTSIATIVLGMTSTHSYSEASVKLSPELSGLLKQEMLAIDNGMKGIISAYVSGDYVAISKIAADIKNSFILKQKITEKQKHELHEKLPESFLAKDKKFHEYAGMLEHVSHKENTELVGFYYSKLLESCVGCHSEHASHRFPEFKKLKSTVEHHH